MSSKSEILFKKAKKLIPGGVNSPVRAGKAVGAVPPFITGARGCVIKDADGNEYNDYVCSWGPMILGHGHPDVTDAVKTQLAKGTSYGAPTELEIEMAELIVEMMPSIEMIRMVNSGTEAAMSAIRLARGYTGREKIIKFDGCYHGHGDSLLVEAGSGVATFGIPGSPGVPKDLARHTISLPFNSLDEAKKIFADMGSEIAAVILEPIPGNMGLVIPDREFLEGLRTLTTDNGALLIFDEVISGFRVAPGGAQSLFGIPPDITCLGKIIGGGLPVGAYGGRADIMSKMAPEGNIYQAGTLSGNPLAMAAGLATLNVLKNDPPYEYLQKIGDMFFSGLEAEAKKAGVPAVVNHIGSMGTLFFSSSPVYDFSTAKAGSADLYARFYRGMLSRGVYIAPSPYELMLLSTAHTEEIIRDTVEKAGAVMRSM